MAPRDYPGVAFLGRRAAGKEHRLRCHTGWGSGGNSATLASLPLPVHPTLQSTWDTETLVSCCVQSTACRERVQLMGAGEDTDPTHPDSGAQPCRGPRSLRGCRSLAGGNGLSQRLTSPPSCSNWTEVARLQHSEFREKARASVQDAPGGFATQCVGQRGAPPQSGHAFCSPRERPQGTQPSPPKKQNEKNTGSRHHLTPFPSGVLEGEWACL